MQNNPVKWLGSVFLAILKLLLNQPAFSHQGGKLNVLHNGVLQSKD